MSVLAQARGKTLAEARRPPRIAVVACLLMFLGGNALAEDVTPGVLILYPNHRTFPLSTVMDEGLRRQVPTEFGQPVAIYSEFLDADQF
ncbi:MAG TPA: hypothetical protein VNQ74_14465, partial [Burkholderiaceae bacterium]|nr:hypothetical protein [Burkholderiaceae bacterium]